VWKVGQKVTETIVIPFEDVLNEDKSDDNFHLAISSTGDSIVAMRDPNSVEIFQVNVDGPKFERKGKINKREVFDGTVHDIRFVDDDSIRVLMTKNQQLSSVKVKLSDFSVQIT